tara:strand:- start:2 stop:688 length:687 start_codon:yes stop_codon:yes gene_type:complete
MSSRLLVVEDDPHISKMIRFALESEYHITTVTDIDLALDTLSNEKIDLILLDWMLPGLTGIELIRRLKKTKGMEQIPVIMLTAKSEEADKLKGFSHGVDDYITKPFSLSELNFRIKAVLRRSKAIPVSEELSEFQFLSDEKKVIVQGNTVSLTKSEFKMLEYLYNNRHKVCSRNEIIEHCWEKDVYDRVIDVNISRMRKKFEICGSKEIISSVPGFGYRFLEKRKPSP